MVPFCQIEGCETNQQIDITSMSEVNYDDHCRSGNQKGHRRMFKHVTGMCPIISYNHFMRRLSEVSSWVSMPTHLSELRIKPNNFNSFHLDFCSNTCTSIEANTAADMLLLLLLFLLDFSTAVARFRTIIFTPWLLRVLLTYLASLAWSLQLLNWRISLQQLMLHHISWALR